MSTVHYPDKYPELPIYIDSTMMNSFRSCPQQFYREFMCGLSSSATSVHLHAGGAIAHGLEFTRRALWEDKLSPSEALKVGLVAFTKFWGEFEPPEGHQKNYVRCAAALVAYFNHFGFDTDPIKPLYMGGKPAVEIRFSIPIPDSKHPSGEPFIYCGRLDFVGEFNGQPYGIDDKTTSSLGNYWLKQWDIRGQFIGYTWALEQMNIHIAGMIARGIGILKTDITFAESINTYAPALKARWYTQLLRDLERMSRMWQDGYWDYNLGESCSSWGGCVFKPLCTSQNPEAWLGQFSKRIWDPLAKDPTHSLESYRKIIEDNKQQAIVFV